MNRKILNIYFASQQACNLHCRYCYVPQSVRHSPKHSDEQVIAALHKLIQKFENEGYAIGKFCLHGSEPSLNSSDALAEIVEIVEQHWAKNSINGLNVSIQTNGVNFGVEYLSALLDKLKNPQRLRIGFSIDPPKQVHDALRCNTFDEVMKNYDFARGMGFPVGILGVISRETINFLGEFKNWIILQLEEYAKYKNPYKIKFKFATGELALSQEQMRSFAEFMYKENLFSLVQIMTPGYCIQSGNECQWYEFDIYGNCYSCNKAYGEEGVFANCNKESLETIISKRKKLYYSKMRHYECSNCDYELLCNSGCPLDRHSNGEMAGKAEECTFIKTIFSFAAADGKHIIDIYNNHLQ